MQHSAFLKLSIAEGFAESRCWQARCLAFRQSGGCDLLEREAAAPQGSGPLCLKLKAVSVWVGLFVLAVACCP